MRHVVPRTFLLFAILALFVASSDARESIDLSSLIGGLGSQPPQGIQRYWIASKTLYIDIRAGEIGAMPVEQDDFWEMNIHSDVVGWGSHQCEYATGTLDGHEENGVFDFERGSRRLIRAGSIGGGAGYLRRASALLFINERVDTINTGNTTHIWVNIQNCYIGRYVVRWTLDAWNGDAFVMDFGPTEAGVGSAAYINDYLQGHDDYYDELANTFDDHTKEQIVNNLWLAGPRDRRNGLLSSLLPHERDNTMLGATSQYWHVGSNVEYNYSCTGIENCTNSSLPAETHELKTVFPVWVFDYGAIAEISDLTHALFELVGYTNAGPVLGLEFFRWNDSAFPTADTNHSLVHNRELDGGVLFHNFHIVDIFGPAENSFLYEVEGTEFDLFRVYYDYLQAYRNSPDLTDRGSELFEISSVSMEHFGAAIGGLGGLGIGDTSVFSIPAATFLPIVKVWRFGSDRTASSPFLLDLFYSSSASPERGCERPEPAEITPDLIISFSNMMYYGATAAYVCRDSIRLDEGAPLEISVGTPIEMEAFTYPFMLWGEFHSDSLAIPIVLSYGYEMRISSQTAPIFVSEYAPITHAEGKGYEFQVGFDKTVPTGTIISLVAVDDYMAFQAFAPVFDGMKDRCDPSPCATGTCYNVPGDYICVCPTFPTFTGRNCSVLDAAADCNDNSTQCLNGGVCNATGTKTGTLGHYSCICDPDYEGDHCERPVQSHSCPLAGNATGTVMFECLNGGACVAEPHGKFTCRCDPNGPWEGKWCEIDTRDCDKDPFACQPHGTCLETANANEYRCQCNPGWNSSETCDVHDICVSSPCLNDGLCEPYNDSGVMVAKCVCAGTWFGDFCEDTFQDLLNDCRNTTGEKCSGHGSCQQQFDIQEHRCACSRGFKGVFCEIAEVCDPNPCEHGGVCSTFGLLDTRSCLCAGGYYGPTCSETLEEYFDDCRFGPGHAKCELNGHGVCKEIHTAGAPESHWECVCNKNWHGEWCDMADVCGTDRNPCGEHGMCYMAAGEAACHCFAGHTGQHCELALSDFFTMNLESGLKKCSVAAFNCVNGDCVSDKCSCHAGWTGPRCEQWKGCNPEPCLNGGSCYPHDNAGTIETKCMCPGSHVGAHCEHTIEEYFMLDCELAGCNQHGSCSADGSCVCEDAWTGEHCEVPSPCASNPCMNHGICSLVNNVVACMCPGEYFGDHCQFHSSATVADCRSKGCSAHGQCGLFDGHYVCQCDSGYHGVACEIEPHCNPNPCHNSGSCMQVGATFMCKCPGDYYGKMCEHMVWADLTSKQHDLEASVDSTASAEVDSKVKDSLAGLDINTLSSTLDSTAAASEMISAAVDALTQHVGKLSSSSTSLSDAVHDLEDSIATKEEVETLTNLAQMAVDRSEN